MPWKASMGESTVDAEAEEEEEHDEGVHEEEGKEEEEGERRKTTSRESPPGVGELLDSPIEFVMHFPRDCTQTR